MWFIVISVIVIVTLLWALWLDVFWVAGVDCSEVRSRITSEMSMVTWKGVPCTDARRCSNSRRLCRFFVEITRPLLVECGISGWCGLCTRADVRRKWYRTRNHLGRASNFPYIFRNSLLWCEVATSLCGSEVCLMRVEQVKI